MAQAQDAQERDNDRHWKNLSGNISLYAHEVRHVGRFGHPACCIYPRCDQTFDPTNLSPIGIQWWLNKLWLTGGDQCGGRLPRCGRETGNHKLAIGRDQQ